MTPEEEEVRRVLGSLPPAGPVPDDVAARLETTLGELLAERAAGEPAGIPAASDESASSTGRRRLWPKLLVAAAAVSVIGLGVGNVLEDAGGAGDTATESGPPPVAGDAAPESAPESPAEGSGGGAAEAYDGDGGELLSRARLELNTTTLARDVARIERLRDATRQTTDQKRSVFAPCEIPTLSRGELAVPVRLDGEPATLVLRLPQAGTRVAQVHACAEPAEVLARTEVEAR